MCPDYTQWGIWPIGLLSDSGYMRLLAASTTALTSAPDTIVNGGAMLQVFGTVITDINLIVRIKAILRSEQ